MCKVADLSPKKNIFGNKQAATDGVVPMDLNIGETNQGLAA